MRSVHLDARPNQARNELKCGNFWRYFFNQRIINSQARYSFRATSCTLRFMISCVACILMHDQTKHGTLFSPFWHSQFRVTSCTLRFYKKMTVLYFSSRMSRNGALTIFAKSCGVSSTLNPRLPPETKIVSKLRADCSMTVATRFFCPNGLMPPTK